MFERFTDRARGVLVEAGNLAKELQSPFIRRHHLLVALLDVSGEGSASVAAVLDDAEIDRAELRAKLVASLQATETPSPGANAGFTREAKKALELSLREALSLGHNYIGREHLLLGILRDPEGALAAVLGETKLTHARAREIVSEESPPSAPRGRRVRGVRTRRGWQGTAAFQSAIAGAIRRADKREPTTGDLLVALAATKGTHFATALGNVPDPATLALAVDKLIADRVPDGTEDAIKVERESVTINDPRIAEAVKNIVGDKATPDQIEEILRRLQG